MKYREYRAQFPYPTPDACQDEPFSYVFNILNQPLLETAIAAASETRGIPLRTESDAPFLWMATRFENGLGLKVRLQGPDERFLDDDYIFTYLYTAPLNNIAGHGGGQAIAEEPFIWVPAGAVLLVNFKNDTAGNLTPGQITLIGAKRRPVNPIMETCR
jgi:hypothetical protein